MAMDRKQVERLTAVCQELQAVAEAGEAELERERQSKDAEVAIGMLAIVLHCMVGIRQWSKSLWGRLAVCIAAWTKLAVGSD